MTRAPTLLAAASLFTGGACAQEVDAAFGSTPGAYPVVITPTRLRQSLAEVPASVTVITSGMLRQFGVMTVPEALRLVPGMAVTQATGPDYRIGYHGTNILSPRRMNVLIDGVSVYRPAFSEVDWKRLPIVIEDIDRIEVTRGPNSAAYGPNSMLGVINIVTKNPKDLERGYASLTLGSRSSVDATARAAFTLAGTSYALTLARSQDHGYDEVSLDDRGHDSTRLERLSLRSHSDVVPGTSLEMTASVVRSTTQVPFADDFQISYPDRYGQDVYVGATWTQQLSPNHELQVRLNHSRQRVRQDWRSCIPTVGLLPEMFALWQSNPAYADAILAGRMPSGGTPADDLLAAAALAAIAQLGPRAFAPTCVTANQNTHQSRTDFELQDTYVASGELRFVGGLGARQQRGQSQTYLNGSQSSSIFWVFGNVEARPARGVTLNAGGYFERPSAAPTSFSPRVAANIAVSANQTLRLVISRGTRSPDIQEQFADWSYTLTDLDPPFNGSRTGRLYQSAKSPGDLSSERIRSKELGYLLNLPQYGAMLDVRWFNDRLTNLISERTNLADFAPTNAGAVRLRGAEVQSLFQWNPRWTAFVNYAYLDNSGATNPLERSQYSRHSGSAGVSHRWAHAWRTALAYYGASGDGLDQSGFRRIDLIVARDLDVAGSPWTASVMFRHLDSPTTRYANGSSDPLVSRFNSRTQIFAQLETRFP